MNRIKSIGYIAILVKYLSQLRCDLAIFFCYFLDIFQQRTELAYRKHRVGNSYYEEKWKIIPFSDIFGPIEKQISAIKVWKKVLKIWSVKLDATRLSTSGRQAHLSVGQSDSCTIIARANDDSISNVYDFV